MFGLNLLCCNFCMYYVILFFLLFKKKFLLVFWVLSNHSFLSCVNVSQCLFSFSTTSLQQRDTQPSPVQGETITGTQVKMTGQQEVLLCVSSSFPPPHSGKRARVSAFPSPQPSGPYLQLWSGTWSDRAWWPGHDVPTKEHTAVSEPWVGSPPLPPSLHVYVNGDPVPPPPHQPTSHHLFFLPNPLTSKHFVQGLIPRL